MLLFGLHRPIFFMELEDKKSRAVANWLTLGVAMTIVQIAIGGITRLTGSGLSITEWDVVTGTLPPLNQAAPHHQPVGEALGLDDR